MTVFKSTRNRGRLSTNHKRASSSGWCLAYFVLPVVQHEAIPRTYKSHHPLLALSECVQMVCYLDYYACVGAGEEVAVLGAHRKQAEQEGWSLQKLDNV